MTPEERDILERKLRRVREAFLGRMIAASSTALKEIDPIRNITVKNAITTYKTCALQEMRTLQVELCSAVIEFVGAASLALADESVEEIVELNFAVLDEENLLGLMGRFEESVDRHMSRYGIRTNLSLLNLEITRAEYVAGVKNGCNRHRSALKDELRTLLVSQSKRAQGKEQNKPGKLEVANEIVKLEPNLFGIGLNLNKVFAKCFFRKR